ncbi:uncharacterized protein LOC108671835 isoform X2 [Hyalella azteca]|nr:uncharacterized protein LOC108671835 isoform X2 [Hyalella azteca]XP_018014919.1 uncharacterized protein LOC108671835 isoform X2 [Hyalella azteca]
MPSSVRAGDFSASFHEDTIHSSPLQSPTVPSTRSSSSASSSSSVGFHPHRTTSMDSLPTSAMVEKVEHIPTRTVGAAPRPNAKAMMFVKTGPAQLYLSATEQMKKAQTIKEMRRQVVKEDDEPDWQQSSAAADPQDDWRANLDKWKMTRRKINEDALERVIEVKKFENEMSQTRRKSKTFSEMREETGKRGLRRNLIVHDDQEADDISSLLNCDSGAAAPKPDDSFNSDYKTNENEDLNENNSITNSEFKSSNFSTTSSSSIKSTTREVVVKELLDQDNKDAKSDAGFCTGSDTGSDGQFHEDNISDTSSALGDKKETHDSLLDAGMQLKDEEAMSCSSMSSSKQETMEYTYDKAIEGYKQFAQTSAKKRTASLSNLASFDKIKTENVAPTGNISNKLNFFVKEMGKEFVKPSSEKVVIMREKNAKVDITKRRTMFEMSQSSSTINMTGNDSSKLDRRRSTDMTASTGNLRSKVASFEGFESPQEKSKTDATMKNSTVKKQLANFSSLSTEVITASKKRTPEKDKNFLQKLASFSNKESGEQTWRSESYDSPPKVSNTLKSKIASFEQLDQREQSSNFRHDETQRSEERSVSTERLSWTSVKKLEVKVSPIINNETTLRNKSKLTENARKAPSVSRVTPFIEVSLGDEKFVDPKRSSHNDPQKRFTVYETIESVQMTDVHGDSAPMYSIFKDGTEAFQDESRVSKSPLASRAEEAKQESTFGPRISSSASASVADSADCPPLNLKGDLSATEAPISTSSPRTADEKSAYIRGCGLADEQQPIYDDVLNTEQPLNTEKPNTEQLMNTEKPNTEKLMYAEQLINTEKPNTEQPTNTEQPNTQKTTDGAARHHTYSDDDINEAISETETVAHSVSSYGKSLSTQVPPKRQLPTIPPTPYKPLTSPSFSSVPAPRPVVFENWSTSGGPIAPPSEPPPPPPPEEDDSDCDQEVSHPTGDRWSTDGVSFEHPSICSPTPSDTPSLVHSEASSKTSSSTREELRRRRSNFLGTSQSDTGACEAESSLLQQQQQEADRKLQEARRSLQQPTAQILNDIDQSRNARDVTRHRYTWEDRVRADTSARPDNLNDTDDGYNYHSKLQELEVEMLRHDRTVINRTISQQQQQLSSGLDIYDDVVPDVPKSDSLATASSQNPQNVRAQNGISYAQNPHTQKSSSVSINNRSDDRQPSIPRADNSQPDISTRQQRAPTASNQPSNSVNYEPKYPNNNYHQPPDTRSGSYQHQDDIREQNSYSSSNYEHNESEKMVSYREQSYSINKNYASEKMYPEDSVPPPEKPMRSYTTCYDSTQPTQPNPPEPMPRKILPPLPKETEELDYTEGPQQHLSRQSRQALSAMPRNRLSDGESWIKRKPDTNRDYSKHWLIQEAEQRRLEQQDHRTSLRQQNAANSVGYPPKIESHSTTSIGSANFTSPYLNANDSHLPRSSDITLNRGLDPMNRAPDPMNRALDPMNRALDPMNRVLDPMNRALDPMNRALDPMNKGLEPMIRASEAIGRLNDSRTSELLLGAGDSKIATRDQQTPTNRNTNPNSWMNQATTYQPLPSPSVDSTARSTEKPLPESIINSITQRVNNRSRPSSDNNSSGRPSPYTTSITGSNSNLHHAASVSSSGHSYGTTDENYHDYMNAEVLHSNYQNYHQPQTDDLTMNQQLYANYPTRPPYTRDHDTLSNGNHPHRQQQNIYDISTPPSIHHHNLHESPQSSPSIQSNLNASQTIDNGSPNTTSSSTDDQRLLSVSGKKKCSHCSEELGRGAAMIIESLRLFYHIPCFVCCVCGVQLGNGKAGADVRVRNHALHCHNCYSNDQGMKFSKV